MTNRCYRVKTETCTEDVIFVQRRVVKKYYCCRGTEPDGAGGCRPVQILGCINNGGCDHICVSTTTPRTCQCRPGYRLVNETQCIDIDECANNNGGCNHQCKNLPGSYYCTCKNGYELDYDLKTCKDINECERGNGGCQHNCTNTESSYYCTCDVGFKLKEGHRCEDDDECTDPIVENGGCSHTCNNVYGDYYCSCPEGYVLDNRGLNCQRVQGGAGFIGGEEPLIASTPKSNQYLVIYVILAVLVVAIAMVLLALFCIRRRLKNKQPVSIFIVGKKEDVEVKMEKGDKEGETSSGSVYTLQAVGDNVYTPPPTGDNVYIDPPAYDEVVDNKVLDLEDPYEECCPPDVKDEKEDTKTEKNVYVNVAFKADDKTKNERYDECQSRQMALMIFSIEAVTLTIFGYLQ